MYDNDKNALLLTAHKNGDPSALDALIKENRGLVKSIALRFCGRGTELEDLLQIGTIGLIKAANGFDPGFGTVFSTYAVHMITGELKRYLRDDGLIKISRTIKRNGYIISRAKEEFTAKTGREPKVSELCELCGMTYENVVEALDASLPVASLQEKLGDDDSSCLEELIGRDDCEKITESIALLDAIKALPAQDRTLLFMRYFRDMTQNDCAKRLGMTQVRISRREKKILELLKKRIT